MSRQRSSRQLARQSADAGRTVAPRAAKRERAETRAGEDGLVVNVAPLSLMHEEW
jgi:hypothetical protein